MHHTEVIPSIDVQVQEEEVSLDPQEDNEPYINKVYANKTNLTRLTW